MALRGLAGGLTVQTTFVTALSVVPQRLLPRGSSLVNSTRQVVQAIAVAVLLWIPFPILRAFYIVPGLAWFAVFGLAVPVAMVERTGFRESLRQGRRLGGTAVRDLSMRRRARRRVRVWRGA